MTENKKISDRLGPEWEEEAKRTLKETRFDPELGMEAARDAQRVVAGELSEADFHEKHHEAFLKEFGVDDRPVVSDKKAERTLNELIHDGRISRRAAFKLAGAGAAMILANHWLGSKALAFGNSGARSEFGSILPGKAESRSIFATKVQMGMVIDLERCDGCLVCVNVCSKHNNLSPGANWMYVMAYREEDQEDQQKFLVRPCQHCTNPPCVKVCPVRARHKREKDGLVLTNYGTCIGCRYCQVSCPYGVNYFEWGIPKTDGALYGFRDYRGKWVDGNNPRGVMGKCTFCPWRQDNEKLKGTVVCAEACPMGAIHFGDIHDPNSPPRRYLVEKEKKMGRISTFRLLDDFGTEPSIIYIGQQPGKYAKQEPGPTAYEDWGLVDKRLDVLQGPDPWFAKTFGIKDTRWLKGS